MVGLDSPSIRPQCSNDTVVADISTAISQVGETGPAMAFDVPVLLKAKNTQVDKTGEATSMGFKEPVAQSQQKITLTFKNTDNYLYKAMAIVKDNTGAIMASASICL